MACNGKVERRRREAEIANSTPESHDAVLAEIVQTWGYAEDRQEFLDRLQSAHARELAEQQATIETLRSRVDAATGLVAKWGAEIEEYDRDCDPNDPEDWASGHRTCRDELQQALAGGKKKE